MDKLKILSYTGKLLAPTHISMTKLSRNNSLHLSKATFSQHLPKSGSKVSVMGLKKDKNTFYMDNNGNPLLAKDREHLHLVLHQPDGKNISKGLFTKHPPKNLPQNLDIVDLGKGTIINANSEKNQFLIPKEQELELPKNVLVEPPQGDKFIAEPNHLAIIDDFIKNKNVVSETHPLTINQVEFNHPHMAETNIYGNDKKNKPFRDLVKSQAIEQINSNQVKDGHIVKVIR